MPVITIGRQIGAGGRTVGHMLATKLKADFLDSELIDEVAHRLALPREEVEAEDEQPGSLLSRLLLALGAANTEPMIPPETGSARRAVLEITQQVIREAAKGENVVIVGRGGAYILHDYPQAMHVFLRAEVAIRVETIMERENKTEEEARRRLKLADENWTAYIKQVYGHDRTLASHYDLVLDTGRLGYDATIAAILAALPGRSSR